MSKVTVTIVFEKDKQVHLLRRGLRLDALNAKSSTPLEYSCRNADCGVCIFSVLKGQENLSPMKDKEKKYLEALRAEQNERLACQCRVFGDVDLKVEDYS